MPWQSLVSAVGSPRRASIAKHSDFSTRCSGIRALRLESLARVIPAPPKGSVMYSKRLLKSGDDFETTFRKRPDERSIEETIEKNIRVSDSSDDEPLRGND